MSVADDPFAISNAGITIRPSGIAEALRHAEQEQRIFAQGVAAIEGLPRASAKRVALLLRERVSQ